MQIFVDSQPVTDVDGSEQTVGELINTVSERIQDRLVVQIECDGHQVAPQELDETLAKPASGFGRLDFITASTVALATEGLSSASQLLSDTEPGRIEAIEKLAIGHVTEAMKTLAPCVRGWQRGFEAIIQVAALRGVSLDETQVDGRPIAEFIREWGKQLQQIKEALEAQDYVLLSDILQYEFESHKDIWPRITQAIASEGGLGMVALPEPCIDEFAEFGEPTVQMFDSNEAIETIPFPGTAHGPDISSTDT